MQNEMGPRRGTLVIWLGKLFFLFEAIGAAVGCDSSSSPSTSQDAFRFDILTVLDSCKNSCKNMSSSRSCRLRLWCNCRVEWKHNRFETSMLSRSRVYVYDVVSMRPPRLGPCLLLHLGPRFDSNSPYGDLTTMTV